MATYRGQIGPNSGAEIIDIPENVYTESTEDNLRKQDEKEDVGGFKFGPAVSTLMWQAGKQHAEKAFNLYANIDILRPYFTAEPQEIVQRILQSFVPKLPSHFTSMVLPEELYGPLMLVFTLIALLLYEMKISGLVVKEGTLMGTAFGVSFGYWLGAAAFGYLLTYVCNTKLTFIQYLSLLGYSLSGHCIILFLGTVFHPEHTHTFFYILWSVIGGLSAARVVCVLLANMSGHPQRLVVCFVIASLNMLDILYLHFAFHKIVKVFS
ncbi:protein YIPF3-like isoform X2 [Centruroides sculpturatus]|uniref:protein YIPF3-like isoform X1 n=1 Tax=Centruroides sculpturatus TaxID=218467 RepID=UPI000C6DBB1C|nr:protein YIPF3-like isoform X1 [Centruroides sculpturatus]XP_023225291.1 protein YIPF3-like isoform X2 [Centruroides sculpturatus]